MLYHPAHETEHVQIDVEETGPVERKLAVEIPTAEVDAAFDAVYRELGGRVNVKGFRKGRVPRSVLERYFGERAQSEALERLVQETLAKALEQAALDVIAEPRLEPGELPKQGSSYAYQAAVEIRPEIELKKVRGLEVTRPEVPEPEQDPVETHLAQWRESQAQVIEEPEGTRCSQGHIAVASFRGTIDGEPFEGGSSDEAHFEIGAGRALPGFEEQLVDHAVGDEWSFELDFPEDYGADELAGKHASFEVSVLGIKRKELPELDDEFAKDVSDFDTLDELRADLQKRVDDGRQRDRERLEREAVLDALVAANPFPLPPSLIDRQLGVRLQRAIEQFARSIPQDQLVSLVERWREEWRPQAERDVALSFLLPEIAKGEQIEVSAEEVDAELAKIAEAQERPLGELKKAYREGGVTASLQAGLLESKVVEFLMTEASLSDA